ncbi:MAG: zf-HC2 domain-containing protein [Lentisphaeria bacterium]|nr:zf-HC2 domain-containing protein [Lentisphaeria bacterium]
MNCRWIQQHVHSILDGELSPRERAALEAHMADCPECQQLMRRAEEEERELRLAFERPTAPDGFAEAVMARLQPSEAGPPAPVLLAMGWRRWVLLLVSSAALVVLYFGLRVFSGSGGQSTEGPGVVAVPPEKLAPVVATTASVRGETFFMLSGDPGWQKLSAGQPLRIGTRLRTGGGAHLKVQIGETVVSQIDEAGLARLTDTGLFLEQGRVFSEVKPGGQGFVVETADGTATVKGTRFEVDRRSGQMTQLRVVEGTVEFSNPEGAVPVSANMQATATAGKVPGSLLYADHFPAVSWASVGEENFDFAAGVSLVVQPDDPGGETRGDATHFVAMVDYGEARYGDLWLYCQVVDTSGAPVAQQRQRISSCENRYRIKKIAFAGLRPATYTARFRVGHGSHAAVTEREFTVR